MNRLSAYNPKVLLKKAKIRISRVFSDEIQPFSEKRLFIMSAFFFGAFVTVLGRAIYIQIASPSESQLKKIASRQYDHRLDLAPYRGLILDKNGDAFAISVKRPSLAVNPRVFDPTKSELKRLSAVLAMPIEKIKEISQKTAYFSWVKRRLDKETAQTIENMNISGLYFLQEPTRSYPRQTLAAQIIGSVGSSNEGLFGIEHQFNKILMGHRANISPSKDAHGKTILFSSDLAAPDLPGHTIQLTIDHVIQEIADEALRKGVIAAKAKSGFALVSDPHSGKILAIANYPTFDPNQIGAINILNTRNHAFLDSFEPGSTLKPLVAAAGIDSRKTSKNDRHNCENGQYKVGGVTFRDDHPAASLTTAETIIRSNNVCTFKIAERLGREELYSSLRRFGLSGQLALPEVFPPVSPGHISKFEQWKPIRFANIAFGQGMTVNGLELTMAYSAIANGGQLMRPQVIDKILSPAGVVTYASTSEVLRRVMSEDTSRVMREILGEVVTDAHGTGKTASIDNYTTGGKTGTAEKVDPATKSYSSEKRVSSFIGLTPVLDPYLVIYVVIDEPGVKPYFGSLRAAPVFAEIAAKSLQYLNVAPDKNSRPVSQSDLKKESNGRSF